jgi:hypothetical protein
MPQTPRNVEHQGQIGLFMGSGAGALFCGKSLIKGKYHLNKARQRPLTRINRNFERQRFNILAPFKWVGTTVHRSMIPNISI